MPLLFPAIAKDATDIDISSHTVFDLFNQNPEAQPADVVRAFLESALLPALKGTCVMNGVETKGNKPDLVGRLVAYVISEHHNDWLESKIPSVIPGTPTAVAKFPALAAADGGAPAASVTASEGVGLSPVSTATGKSEAESASSAPAAASSEGKWASVLLLGHHNRFEIGDPNLARALKALPESPIKIHDNVLEAMSYHFPSESSPVRSLSTEKGFGASLCGEASVFSSPPAHEGGQSESSGAATLKNESF